MNPRSEAGFTLAEIMIAMMISLIVAGATLAVVTSGTRSSFAGQRQTELLSVAQQQIEQIRQTVHQSGFDSLAVNGTSSSYPAPDPTLPTDPAPANPDDYISGYGTATASWLVKSNYHNSGSATLATERLAFDTVNGAVTPYSTLVPAGGGATATVWRYITQRVESCNASLGACTGDSRRIVIAVRLDQPGNGSKNSGPNTPLYMTTVIDRPQPSNTPSYSNGLRVGVQIQ